MEAPAFAAEVVAVSVSGVLGPGPLFFANMMYGTREGARSGIKVAHGHAVVEIAVIAAISAGLFSAFASKGSSVLKSRYYGLLLIVLSGVLIYYGMQFLLSGIM